ncbi:hypothetical protein SS50377_26676 [Spironucleus salmonicida]|uniref:Uncharacterized protein n=1 Tax=Spironucleus salmonicida TaxID=348837 RepID=A0A9P8RVA7_9EUKA|nr:hypothetical protein SS50377_26676 [Spironucleus salmonicida]
MTEQKRTGQPKLIDIHSLQAVSFLTDSSIVFDPESIDLLNSYTYNYMDLILSKAEQFIDPQTRVLTEDILSKVMNILNISKEIQ